MLYRCGSWNSCVISEVKTCTESATSMVRFPFQLHFLGSIATGPNVEILHQEQSCAVPWCHTTSPLHSSRLTLLGRLSMHLICMCCGCNGIIYTHSLQTHYNDIPAWLYWHHKSENSLAAWNPEWYHRDQHSFGSVSIWNQTAVFPFMKVAVADPLLSSCFQDCLQSCHWQSTKVWSVLQLKTVLPRAR